jgi:hypothetical protein
VYSNVGQNCDGLWISPLGGESKKMTLNNDDGYKNDTTNYLSYEEDEIANEANSSNFDCSLVQPL